MKTKFLVWTPFTGLGLYGGFRGNRWLKNRIKIFKQFVIPSMLNQTDTDFIFWVAWRPEERENPHVKELLEYMQKLHPTVFTYGGLCFYDDKFEDAEAREKLSVALMRTLPDLMDTTSDCDEVQVLLLPSDDLYASATVASIKKIFKETKKQAVGFTHGYICNYHTKEILEYNPNTNPPFFAARFPRSTFFDPAKHLKYISTKRDEGKYKKGTPYPSHEWIPNAFDMAFFNERGFMVGTHGENISTHFNHPFGGRRIEGAEKLELQARFGINHSPVLKIPFSLRKWFMRQLPYGWQRKLRYVIGEKCVHRLYTFLRS